MHRNVEFHILLVAYELSQRVKKSPISLYLEQIVIVSNRRCFQVRRPTV